MRWICFAPTHTENFRALYASSPYQKNLVYLPSVPAFHERETNQIEWFVERGYVYVHADIRGSGVSEGMWKFHSIEEQRDHYDLVEWMAQQEWCTGKVGMIGNPTTPGFSGSLRRCSLPTSPRSSLLTAARICTGTWFSTAVF